jgi:hypothetical protein
MTKTKIVLDDLTDDEARALAQMVKRMTWHGFAKFSANASEHQNMDNAAIKLRRALAEAWIDPR